MKRTARTSHDLSAPPRSYLYLLGVCLWTLAAAGGAAANTQVNKGPAGVIQNSPSVTLVASMPGNVVAAYVSDPWAMTGIGTSYSLDGGVTWFDSAIMPTSVFGNDIGPSVVADNTLFVYAGFASYDALPPANMNSGIYVSRSNDGGVTFSAPVPVSVQSGPPGTLPWETMPKIEADDFPMSPFHLQVYALWERDQNNWINSDVCFSSSPPGGTAWAPPLTVNDIVGTDWVLLPDLAVGMDGSIEAAWLDTPFWTQVQGEIWVDRSVDGGNSFGQDVPVISFWAVPIMLTDAVNFPQPGLPTYMAVSYPSVEINPSNPNHIGIVFAADPDDGPAYETRVDVGDLPPGTADAHLLDCTRGGTNLSWGQSYVYAVWIDDRTGTPDVMFNRSIPGPTLNWAPGEQLLSMTSGPHYGSDKASIVSDNSNNAYVAWEEWSGSPPPTSQICFNRTLDGGATWLPMAVDLDSGLGIAASDPVISCSQDSVCVAWLVAGGVASTDIYAQRTLDAGTTWLPMEVPVRLGGVVYSLDIAQWQNNVYLVWEESTGLGSAVWFRSSVDNGRTWGVPIQLNSGPPNTLAYGPKVCCEQNNVYAAWSDDRNGMVDPYFAWSNANGLPGTWSADFPINTSVVPGTSMEICPQIACGWGNVYVVCQSDRNQPAGPNDIYLNYSLGGGGNWQGERRIDTGDKPPGFGRDSNSPRLAVGGIDLPLPSVVVTWEDDRYSAMPWVNFDICANISYDGGATWMATDFRVDRAEQPGLNSSHEPHVICPGGVPFFLWRELRNGLGDIYANVFLMGPDEGDVFYTESFDGGQTWLNPAIRVNDDPLGGSFSDQSHPWLDFKRDGAVDVVWYDKRAYPNDDNTDVYFAVMPPGAGAFSPNLPVNTQPILPPANQWLGDYIWVDVDSLRAHIVWTDTRQPFDLLLGDIFHVAAENPYLVDVREESMGSALREGIFLVRPNPFTSTSTVHYNLKVCEQVRLDVYDVTGRLVKTLVNGSQEPGSHAVQWDGRDATGRPLAAGVYFYRLQTPSISGITKAVRLK